MFIIDEVEHNDFITPELLKYIKDSKFAVVDSSEILKCIDLNRIDKYKDNQSVKIKLIKRHRNFNIYGTNHPDKKDSSIKILVNNINGLI